MEAKAKRRNCGARQRTWRIKSSGLAAAPPRHHTLILGRAHRKIVGARESRRFGKRAYGNSSVS